MTEKRKYVRQVVAYSSYFKEFKKTLSKEVLCKIYQIFIYIMTLEQVPAKYLKAITNTKGLFEIRVEDERKLKRRLLEK